jgi:hypothetical protein
MITSMESRIGEPGHLSPSVPAIKSFAGDVHQVHALTS